MSPALLAAEPFEAPFISTFTYGRRQLLFFASDHDSGLHSTNVRAIRSTIEDHSIDVVILEGFESSMGESPESIRSQAEPCATEPLLPDCSEMDQAILVASVRGIPFVGAEPGPTAEWEQIRDLSDGEYTVEDYIALELSRYLVLISRGEERVPNDAVPGRLGRLIDYYRKILPLPAEYSVDSYRQWLKKHFGTDAFVVGAEQLAPKPEAGSSILQKLSYLTTRTRDINLLKVIEQELRSHDRVLVIYGSAHLAALRKVLSSATDRSSDKKARPR